jgi:hypothetical protein
MQNYTKILIFAIFFKTVNIFCYILPFCKKNVIFPYKF